MPIANPLVIYDPDTLATRSPEFRNNGAMKLLPIQGGIEGLRRELDKLVKEGWIFPRVVFSTHGGPGRIRINNDRIYASTLKDSFGNRGYERLFQTYDSRMYFDGCNVAEGEEGWKFLAMAASIFLGPFGGMTFGWTSVGFGMHPIISIFTSGFLFVTVSGRTIHPWGEARYVAVAPGGNVVKRGVLNDSIGGRRFNPTPRLP